MSDVKNQKVDVSVQMFVIKHHHLYEGPHVSKMSVHGASGGEVLIHSLH